MDWIASYIFIIYRAQHLSVHYVQGGESNSTSKFFMLKKIQKTTHEKNYVYRGSRRCLLKK